MDEYYGSCVQCGADLEPTGNPRPADAPEDEIELQCSDRRTLVCDRGWYILPL